MATAGLAVNKVRFIGVDLASILNSCLFREPLYLILGQGRHSRISFQCDVYAKDIVCLFVCFFVCLFIPLRPPARAVPKMLGNFYATFLISANFFLSEVFLKTFHLEIFQEHVANNCFFSAVK